MQIQNVAQFNRSGSCVCPSKTIQHVFFLVIKDILTQTIQMEDILDVIMLLAHGCLSMSTQCCYRYNENASVWSIVVT